MSQIVVLEIMQVAIYAKDEQLMIFDLELSQVLYCFLIGRNLTKLCKLKYFPYFVGIEILMITQHLLLEELGINCKCIKKLDKSLKRLLSMIFMIWKSLGTLGFKG